MKNVVLALLVLSAGCLSGDVIEEPTEVSTEEATPSATATPPATPTRTPTPTPKPISFACGNISLPPTQPVESNLSVRSYPNAPAEWSRTAIREYVVQFERAYAWSYEIAHRNLTNLTLSFNRVHVRSRSDGYHVQMGITIGLEDGEITGHQPYSVAYLVTRRGVLRNRTLGPESEPDPTNGTTVACFAS